MIKPYFKIVLVLLMVALVALAFIQSKLRVPSDNQEVIWSEKQKVIDQTMIIKNMLIVENGQPQLPYLVDKIGNVYKQQSVLRYTKKEAGSTWTTPVTIVDRISYTYG